MSGQSVEADVHLLCIIRTWVDPEMFSRRKIKYRHIYIWIYLGNSSSSCLSSSGMGTSSI